MLAYEDTISQDDKNLYVNFFSGFSAKTREEFHKRDRNYLIRDYAANITTWYIWQLYFEQKEDYEMCSTIQRMIQIEEREFSKVFRALKCTTQEQLDYYTDIISETKEIAKEEVYGTARQKI